MDNSVHHDGLRELAGVESWEGEGEDSDAGVHGSAAFKLVVAVDCFRLSIAGRRYHRHRRVTNFCRHHQHRFLPDRQDCRADSRSLHPLPLLRAGALRSYLCLEQLKLYLSQLVQ